MLGPGLGVSGKGGVHGSIVTPAIVRSGEAPKWTGPGKPQPRIAAHEAHGGETREDCRPVLPLHGDGGYVWNLFHPLGSEKGAKGEPLWVVASG